MTELEKIERRLDDLSSQVPEHEHGWHSVAVDRKLLRESFRLLDICKEQNAMLCRFAQDHEAYNQGKADLAREIEVLMNQEHGIFTGADLIKWMHERTDPSTLRPDYEEALDKLWEARKAAKLLDDYKKDVADDPPHLSSMIGPHDRDILVRLLNLLTS